MEEISDKTKLYVQDKLSEERHTSNKAYAMKLTERIVFTVVGLLALSAVAYIADHVFHITK